MQKLIETVNFFLQEIDSNALNRSLEKAKNPFHTHHNVDRFFLIALKSGSIESYVKSIFNSGIKDRNEAFKNRLYKIGRNKVLVNMLIFTNDNFFEICAKTVIDGLHKMVNVKINKSGFNPPWIQVKVKTIKGE